MTEIDVVRGMLRDALVVSNARLKEIEVLKKNLADAQLDYDDANANIQKLAIGKDVLSGIRDDAVMQTAIWKAVADAYWRNCRAEVEDNASIVGVGTAEHHCTCNCFGCEEYRAARATAAPVNAVLEKLLNARAREEAERWAERFRLMPIARDKDVSGLDSADPLDCVEAAVGITIRELVKKNDSLEYRNRELADRLRDENDDTGHENIALRQILNWVSGKLKEEGLGSCFIVEEINRRVSLCGSKTQESPAEEMKQLEKPTP